MQNNVTGGKTIKTTKTVFTIIEMLQRNDGMTLSEVTGAMPLAKSSVHAHLTTLQQIGYVVREGEFYYPSMRFLGLGSYVKRRKAAYVLASEKTRKLAEQTNERANFMVEENLLAVYVAKADGENAVPGDPGVGKQAYLHSSAGGKAILAHKPRSAVDDYIEKWGLKKRTEHTITEPEVLYRELDRVVDKGYALNQEEAIKGLHAVAVPVMDPDGDIIGSLGISGPTNRLKGDRLTKELPDLLSGTANEMELTIAYG